jgi:SAM-dependent methyltransferase
MRSEAIAAARQVRFEWGENPFDIPNFAETSAKRILERMQGRSMRKALDVGCGSGRRSFELARGGFDEVTGTDASVFAVKYALKLKEGGVLRCEVPVEAGRSEPFEVRLRSYGLEHASKKVNFWRADNATLKELFCGYDLIVASEIAEQPPVSIDFLQSLHRRLLPGGLFVFLSVYDNAMDAESQQSIFERIASLLSPMFRLKAKEDIPYIYGETARRYRHDIAEMSVWERV